jgi:peptidoglycan-N-acetylglucosamine deacetylase
MKQVLAAATCVLAMLAATATGGVASECPGNPQAIGTSRVLGVDPSSYRGMGAAQLLESLPLRDHELVLTFDDGPMRPATDRVLDALRAQCAAATFFIIGARARNAPDLVRRAYDEGQAIGTHTETHPHLGGLTAA